MKGEYILHLPVGTYTVVCSKENYVSQAVENVEVHEDQTAVVNFELIGGENMGTHIESIVVEDGSMITIHVPVNEPTKPIKFLKANLETPLTNETVYLLPPEHTEENPLPPIQAKTTDMNGIATFENVLHGNYIIKIS